MAYLGNQPGLAQQRITQTFTATAGQTQFTPNSGYFVGYLDVFLNGVKLAPADYTAMDGIVFMLAAGASLDDVVESVAYIPRGLSDGYTKSEMNALLDNISRNIDGGSASTIYLTSQIIDGGDANG